MSTESEPDFQSIALYSLLTLSESQEYRELQIEGTDEPRITQLNDLARARLDFLNDPANQAKFKRYSERLGEARRTIV